MTTSRHTTAAREVDDRLPHGPTKPDADCLPDADSQISPARTRGRHRDGTGAVKSARSRQTALGISSLAAVGVVSLVAGLVQLGPHEALPSASHDFPVQRVESPCLELVAFLGLFGNGTADSPNAGRLFGNGYSYGTVPGDCAGVCNGGSAGLFGGNGGNGFNGGDGGDGGDAGLFGSGGNGGNGLGRVP